MILRTSYEFSKLNRVDSSGVFFYHFLNLFFFLIFYPLTFVVLGIEVKILLYFMGLLCSHLIFALLANKIIEIF